MIRVLRNAPGAMWVNRHRPGLKSGAGYRPWRRFPPLRYQLAARRGGRPDIAFPGCNRRIP